MTRSPTVLSLLPALLLSACIEAGAKPIPSLATSSEAKASDAAMTHIGCKIEMLSRFVALPVSLTLNVSFFQILRTTAATTT